MSEANDKRYVSIPFGVAYGPVNDIKKSYGAMTARVGLFKKIFKDGGDIAAGCDKEDVTKSVKGHTRTRKIGGASKSISGYSYSVESFPRKNVQFGSAGVTYSCLIDGSWWTFRVSGKQSTFHSYMCSNKSQLNEDFYYKTEKGASYYVNKKDD